MMINRLIELPKKQSFFLSGPRQTGKSTLIETLYPKAIWKVDLLQNEIFFRYSKDPGRFRKEAEEKIKHAGIRTIFVDEIQREPLLLNEVQSLMQSYECQFILTGSSSRKLKRGGANLLAGRALERRLFPFVYQEIKESFDLDNVLLYGTLPAIWGIKKKDQIEILSAYTNTYLREEIQAESLVRNLGGFSRFLDVAAVNAANCSAFHSSQESVKVPLKRFNPTTKSWRTPCAGEDFLNNSLF